ncbi:Oxysterol-binding protein [Backusella circina FSU 941]|nr:Oxysterol-binding protein [Backusella circina FSU 941]
MLQTENSALESIPADQQSSFTSFLKTLASFTGDLSSLTCPSFLLAPISLLEYSSFWADQPDLLSDISKSKKPEERFYGAIKWFISSLNGSFSSRVPKGEWEKKPFNPILGEQFICGWNDNATRIVCEQVSHHPPVSGFYIENKNAGVIVNGHDGQKTRFSGTQMLVDQIGYCTLKLVHHNDETYLFTLPSVSVNGIWYAAPYVELYGNSFVQSTSGFFASIEYTTKGWISGEVHHFKATISHPKLLSNPTVIEGQWAGKSTLTKHNKKPVPFLDLNALKKPEKTVKPIEQQDELESRRIWQKVSEALKAGDYATASAEKSTIENQQRALRKEREMSQQTWMPRYFVSVQDGEEVYGKLRDEIIEKADISFIDTMGEGGWLYKA